MSIRSSLLAPFALLLSISLGAACGPPTAADDDDIYGADAGSGADANDINPPDASTPSPDAYVEQNCTETFVLEGYTDASEVLLTGSFTTPTAWAANTAEGAIPMTLGSTSWSVELELEPGVYQYKFIIDGDTWVHDESNPRTVDDGYGGVNSVYECGSQAAVCGDPDAFDWRDAVMYFVMVDRFRDSDDHADPVEGASGMDSYGNSGQYEGGDLPGVREEMGYLADLGVTAIWLSAPFENRDYAGAAIDSSDPHMYSGYHGYWPSPANIDYSNPDDPSPRPQVESRVGNEDDLFGLIDDAHSSTSANGHGIKVLFDYVMNHVDINSGLYAAHWDWFARDGDNFALCGPGNLWNDSYWGTRCAFTDYLPPFDMYNEQARTWSVDDAMWWAKEYGIDGYRLDAIKHVPLSWLTDLRSRLNTEISEPAGGRFYLVGETFDYFDRDLLKQFIDPQTMLDGQFDFPFKRELCEAVFNPSGSLSGFRAFMDGNDGYYNAAPTNTAVMTTWIGNHDIPRAIHFADWHFGNCTQGSDTGNGWTGDYPQPANAAPYERLGLAFAIMMTNPGIPLIYYGDEIGLAGGGDPGNRHMMIWDDSQLNDHQKALRESVRKLANIRGQYKILSRGTRTTLHDDQDTWVYRMGGCGDELEEVIVAINRADDGRWVTIPSGSYTDQMTGADIDGGTDYQIPARKFMVLAPR